MEIGIQVSSLKPLLMDEGQVKEAFTRIRNLGCRCVQLQWIHPAVSTVAIADLLKESGIISVSVQDLYETVRQNLSYYTNLNTLTGGRWLCISRIPERFKSREGLDAFAEELRTLQKEKLDPLGQKLCFHPVRSDYNAIPAVNAVDCLLEMMPEVNVCLDLYQLHCSGGDLCGYIHRLAGRVCMVHIKDGIHGTLVPAGQGEVNWDGVIPACLDVGVPYAFVEQETWQHDPYVCMQQAMDWVAGEVAR